MIYMGLYRSYPFQRQRIRHRPKLPGLLESLNGFRGSLIQSQKAILSQLDSELEKVRSRNDENNIALLVAYDIFLCYYKIATYTIIPSV